MNKKDIYVGKVVMYHPIIGGNEEHKATIISGPLNVGGRTCCFIDIRSGVVSIDSLSEIQSNNATMKNTKSLITKEDVAMCNKLTKAMKVICECKEYFECRRDDTDIRSVDVCGVEQPEFDIITDARDIMLDFYCNLDTLVGRYKQTTEQCNALKKLYNKCKKYENRN